MNNLFAILLLFYISTVCASDLFHVKSKVTFFPDATASYFGYSVLLSEIGLNIGAPKARSRVNTAISPGIVFTCPLGNLDSANVSCNPVGRDDQMYRLSIYQDDMWFGATLASVNGKLLVCAPRITTQYFTPYQSVSEHNLAQGACFIRTNSYSPIYPLKDNFRLALKIDGSRPEYGDSGTLINYNAYGQSGMSAKVTENNHILIGAPGVLEWTGIITDFVSSRRFVRAGHWKNPYYTPSLSRDEYFGYSVDSGVFDETGVVFYVGGAPRGKKGYGQVIVYDPTSDGLNDREPLKIKAQLEGPHLGSYFGASLCVVDLDGDGLNDLLVGAPNFIKRETILTYDQGAVFVFLNRKQNYKFYLQPAVYVTGSGKSGARFGASIAHLGDLDADGYNDVAIGAPFEDDGMGVVYIYKGNEYGLKKQYSQRIISSGARGFGISLSNGYDVDKNSCNDLAIGAHDSSTAYLYRSVPTIKVMSSIKVLDAKNLKLSVGNFTTSFCVTVPPNRSGPDAALTLRATVLVDPEGNRAKSLSATDYKIIAKSGLDTCDEQVIQVNTSADFSKPISLKFNLQPDTNIDSLDHFPINAARLSEDSILQSSFLIQMLSDCGDDLICTPWLDVSIEPLTSEYVPGDVGKLGAKITVVNTNEPAYSVKLHVSLPCPPIRLPQSCSLKNLDLLCDLPAPLKRDQTAEWEVELEYTWEGSDKELKILAGIEDPLYSRNISGEAKLLVIPITPKSNYVASGRPEPNRNISISRESFDKKQDILFNHYFEVTNKGPSDFFHVETIMILPKEAELLDELEDSTANGTELKFGVMSVKANTKAVYILPLRFNYSSFAAELDEKLEMNLTSTAYFYLQNYHGSTGFNVTLQVTTTLELEPVNNLLLYIIIGSVVGLIVLAAIIFGLYKFGFFSRTKKEELKQLIENSSSDEPFSSLSASGENSNQSLESDSDL